jgi:hypothetical protein
MEPDDHEPGWRPFAPGELRVFADGGEVTP